MSGRTIHDQLAAEETVTVFSAGATAVNSGGTDKHSADTGEATEQSTSTHTGDVGLQQANPGLPGTGRYRWFRSAAIVVIPMLATLLAAAAGYLKWQDGTARYSRVAAVESVEAASGPTVKMLSYQPDSVEKDLHQAGDRLTGSFREDYDRLITDVVIPGAKDKQVSAVATVPAAASISAGNNHAVVMVFVDQTTTIGQDPPSAATSVVRVTLEKVGGRWLVSKFDPI